MPIDKVIAVLDDLQKYCAEMAQYPDSAPRWGLDAAALSVALSGLREKRRAYNADGEPPTWFQRLKACQSPEEMAGLLNTNSRIFCPLVDASCVGVHDAVCTACITEWLGREAEA